MFEGSKLGGRRDCEGIFADVVAWHHRDVEVEGLPRKEGVFMALLFLPQPSQLPYSRLYSLLLFEAALVG